METGKEVSLNHLYTTWGICPAKVSTTVKLLYFILMAFKTILTGGDCKGMEMCWHCFFFCLVKLCGLEKSEDDDSGTAKLYITFSPGCSPLHSPLACPQS